ncbi:uncharacterized protein LOC116610276 [Nematostella vectensis]|uniref:uncharacterized protein LOC116610276 n=1 Tax=Nematostella vectensis TaxID=45351 RepID=UPI00139053C1|nr:uncharacterized protein LOC116610276 [Nematostella vectensis]
MPDSVGYLKARELLHEQYGQSYHIATAFVGKIVNGPTIANEDGKALQKFSILLTSCLNTLNEIGYASRLENPEGFQRIMERLPFRLKQQWREIAVSITVKEKRDPTLRDMQQFVEARSRVANHPIYGKLTESKPPNSVNQPQKRYYGKPSSFVAEARQESISQNPTQNRKQVKCPSCEKDHWLSQCPDFKKASIAERKEIIKNKNLCRNCLVPGHYVFKCSKGSFCRIEVCDKKHSTFLHKREERAKSKEKENEQTSENAAHAQSKPSNGYVQTFKSSPSAGTAIGPPIVPVHVRAKGHISSVRTYAFLDPGSNTSFCTNKILKQLNIKGEKTTLSLTTLHGKNKPVNCFLVDLEVLDLSGKICFDLPSVYSRPSLPVFTSAVAKQQDTDKWSHLEGVYVRNIDAEIGLLIGNDCPVALQPSEVRQSQDGGPYAARTMFCWVINGPLGREAEGENVRTANLIHS